MNQMLEQRIANLMGDTEPMPMMMQMGGEVDAMPTADQAVEQLLMAREEAEDPTERMVAEKAIEGAQIAQESELAALAQQIAAAGRGPDTTLAHLTPGEVVLPPEIRGWYGYRIFEPTNRFGGVWLF
jgi:predicted YcjX-like family ATPase